ncbi:MAG: hypothetical protein MJH10_11455 [Epibacterium sp.]|nr:hypothetical protein [Epibacterium sp.]NQX74163.1 hypothetical protein [Epibacterium sp.]
MHKNTIKGIKGHYELRKARFEALDLDMSHKIGKYDKIIAQCDRLLNVMQVVECEHELLEYLMDNTH